MNEWWRTGLPFHEEAEPVGVVDLPFERVSLGVSPYFLPSPRPSQYWNQSLRLGSHQQKDVARTSAQGQQGRANQLVVPSR